MKRERKHYDREYKQMAVNLCLTGRPVSEVAKELGIRSEMLRRWRREFSEYGEGSFSGHVKANLTPEQKEISKLKKELKDAQLERDILKKAISTGSPAVFSKGDSKYSNS